MEDYSQTQLDYKERLKNRLKKQLQIVDEDRQFNDEEIDEMIETGDMNVFDEGFIKIQQNKQILDELEVRKNEMLNLEKAIEDVHQAARYQSSARREKIWIVIMLLVVLA